MSAAKLCGKVSGVTDSQIVTSLSQKGSSLGQWLSINVQLVSPPVVSVGTNQVLLLPSKRQRLRLVPQVMYDQQKRESSPMM